MDNQNNASNNLQQSSGSIDEQLFDNGLSYKDIIEKDVLELMGFTTLTSEKKEELHQKIYQAIEDRVAARLYDIFNDAEREQYQKMLDEKKYEEIKVFLNSKKINIDKMLSEEAIAMKLELYEDSRFVRSKLKEEIIDKKQE